MVTMFLTTMLSFVIPLQAACPVDSTELRSNVNSAIQAYQDWKWDDLDDQYAIIQEEIGCLSEIVSSDTARELHLLHAMVAANRQDQALAFAAFRGLLSIDHDFQPSDDLAAPGSMLRAAFDSAAVADSTDGEDLPGGVWFLDGRSGARLVPFRQTALIQLVEPGGDIRSWYSLGDQDSIQAITEPQASAQGGTPEEPQPLQQAPEQTPGVAPSRAEETGGEPTAAETTTAPVEPGAASRAEPVASRPLPITPTSSEDAVPGAVARQGHASRALLIGGLVSSAASAAALIWAESLDGRLQATDDAVEAESIYNQGVIITLAGHGLGVCAGGLVLGAVLTSRW